MIIESLQEYDEFGDLEELTWDLFPMVGSDKTLHLDEHGLPKIGTVIYEGMIVVGKIAKSKLYNKHDLPNSLDIHGLSQEELCSKFSHLWINKSLYADSNMIGVVTGTKFEMIEGHERVTVTIADM